MSLATSILVEPSLTLKRRLKATPSEVYAAWTDPAKVVKWFGPDAGPVKDAEIDARVGGRYLWMGNIVPGAETTIIPHDATRRPKLIQGVLTYDRWVIPRALDWLVRAQHRVPLHKLVSRTYPLEEINAAFEQA